MVAPEAPSVSKDRWRQWSGTVRMADPPEALDVDERPSWPPCGCRTPGLRMVGELLKRAAAFPDREPEPVAAYRVMDREGHRRRPAVAASGADAGRGHRAPSHRW